MTSAKFSPDPYASPPAYGTRPFVATLAAFDRNDLESAGGKGANLGELVRAGFPVPDGFVVTTAAYDTLLRRDGLADRFASLLDAGETDGGTIRGAVTAAEMPAEVADAVLAAHRELGEGPVAVRSSATAEDLPDAAFAGQQDTYLNVVGAEAVLDAVHRCWASLWTERAIAYRERQDLDPVGARIAVVVQRMVAAEAAGVMFTADPVTGARDDAVVDASAGLGEAVVSGLVTPDHYVVDKRSGRLKEWRPGRRELAVRARADGGVEQVNEDQAGTGPVLERHALRRLVRHGAAIERHFGRPQDIEWAWAEGKAFIVQARPITALPEPAPAAAPPGRLERTMAHMVGEMLPVRPYPLDMTTWTPALWSAVTAMLRFVGVAVPSLDRICVEEDGVVVRIDPPRPRPTPRVLLAPVRLLRNARRYDPDHWMADPLFTDARARARAIGSRDLRTLPWSELLTTLAEAVAMPGQAFALRIRYFPRAALAAVRLRLALTLLGRRDQFAPLLAGVETATTRANRELDALAEAIRSSDLLARLFAANRPADLLSALERAPSPAAGFRDELRAFLDRYGQRETVSPLLATQPTWKDSPEFVLGLLQGLAASPGSGGREEHHALDTVLTHPVFRVPRLRRSLTRLVGRARPLQQIREDSHFYGTLALPTVRRVFLELGRRLRDAEVLDEPEDVFHLRLGELERIGAAWPPPAPLARELREIAAAREAKRTALADTPLLDPRLTTPTRPDDRASEDVLLHGTPGSRGEATGPARIVRDPSEFGKLRTGDVLVAPHTNPAWTPLFQRAAAVVVDTGSAASHAAIVAREYGIPAVMGTVDGTRSLTDDQPVRVDASRGLVLPASLARS